MRALAVCLAGVIWVVAGSEKSRTTPAPTFDAIRDARVVVKNVPQGMVVTQAPSSVTVRLRGARELEAAGIDEVIAVVNLAGVTPGQHLLTAEPLPPPGFEVVRSGAISVGVTVEELVSAEFDVEVAIAADLAPEGMTRAMAAPSRVQVEGPAGAVGSVSHVVALARTLVDEAPAEGEESLDGPIAQQPPGAVAALLALDDHGEAVTGVVVYPGTVLVRWESH